MTRKHQSMDIYNVAITLKNKGEKRKEISNQLNVSLSTLDNWFYSNKKPFVSRKYATKNLGIYAKQKKIYPEKITNYELAYLLGTLYSDGCSSRGFKLTVIDRDFCIANKKILDKLLQIDIKIKKKERVVVFDKSEYPNIYYEINIVRKKLKDYLEKNNLEFKTKKEIYWFVSGFFDGDGCISLSNKYSGSLSLAQKNKNILKIIQNLLLKISIKSNIRFNKTNQIYYLFINKKKDLYNLYKYGNISINRKKEKIKYILLNGNKKYTMEEIKNE